MANSPEITTVEQATNYYVERMNTDQFKAQLIDVIEMGVPLATLANTIQLASVMEGVHSVDVGMLVIPIIVELLMTIAEAEGVQYQTGMEGMETERPTAVSRIINDKMNELRAPTEDIGIEETSRIRTRRATSTYGFNGKESIDGIFRFFRKGIRIRFRIW